MFRTMFLFLVVMLAGCGSVQRSDFQMVREILSLAKQDKVAGKLKVHLNGQMEMGMNEGIYFGSPGSVVDADLMFRMENVSEK